jgi:hypothetical protein
MLPSGSTDELPFKEAELTGRLILMFPPTFATGAILAGGAGAALTTTFTLSEALAPASSVTVSLKV